MEMTQRMKVTNNNETREPIFETLRERERESFPRLMTRSEERFLLTVDILRNFDTTDVKIDTLSNHLLNDPFPAILINRFSAGQRAFHRSFSRAWTNCRIILMLETRKEWQVDRRASRTRLISTEPQTATRSHRY